MVIRNKKVVTGALVTSILIATCILSLAFYFTHQSISSLRAFQFETATTKANQALIIVRPLSLATFRAIPDIEFWREALTLITESDELNDQLTNLVTMVQPTLEEAKIQRGKEAKELVERIDDVSARLKNMDEYCQQRLFFVSVKQCSNVTMVEKLVADSLVISRWLIEEDPRFIVLFQNTEELRATGGFMGSYAKVQFDNGTLSELIIEDIYEPDGQFTGYVEAPAGVREYLSSGKGMRLPDANWQVDFPSSAQTILNYFALGKEQSIDGVIAVNSDLVEKLLMVTGDIYLPDYSVTVTSENFTALARADRDQFFPGSQQKTNFLGHFFNVLKVKLTNLNEEQKVKLAFVLRDSLTDKTIQLFSSNNEVQQVYENRNWAGALNKGTPKADDRRPKEKDDQRPAADGLIYLVESNVGINKANKHVERSVAITSQPDSTEITINFSNLEPRTSNLGYINYQRLVISPQWTVKSVQIDGKNIEQWDEEMITNSHGEEFKQIGFLVTVPEQSQTKVKIILDNQLLPTASSLLTILKQPGLPATPYTITTNGEISSFILEKDTVIEGAK